MIGLDEAVHLVPHDPAWAALARTERGRLRAALGTAAVAIAHIGSTAVPGLLGKPVIDLLVGLRAYPPEPELIQAVCALGYEHLGEAGVAGRVYLRRRGAHSFNVHLVGHGSAHWRANLALRAYLRGSAGARARYAATKTAALASGATTLLAYSAAKAGMLAELVQEALGGPSDPSTFPAPERRDAPG